MRVTVPNRCKLIAEGVFLLDSHVLVADLGHGELQILVATLAEWVLEDVVVDETLECRLQHHDHLQVRWLRVLVGQPELLPFHDADHVGLAVPLIALVLAHVNVPLDRRLRHDLKSSLDVLELLVVGAALLDRLFADREETRPHS